MFIDFTISMSNFGQKDSAVVHFFDSSFGYARERSARVNKLLMKSIVLQANLSYNLLEKGGR